MIINTAENILGYDLKVKKIIHIFVIDKIFNRILCVDRKLLPNLLLKHNSNIFVISNGVRNPGHVWL